MSHWAQAPLDRHQVVLFAPRLEDAIDVDHPVRLFEEVLSAYDWAAWEGRYCGLVGRRPIHPRILAGVILYGLSQGIRSSRQLERSCENRLDMIWLTEGLKPDHTTISNFRKSFKKELKDLYCHIGRVALAMGLIRLEQVGIDGSRVNANSSRHRTARSNNLEDRLAKLDEQIEKMLAESEEADQKEDGLFGVSESANRLPTELAKAQDRHKTLSKALKEVQALDARRGNRKDVCKRGAQIPVADSDARVLQNKEGGYGPNYTPVAAVDGHAGLIVATEVINDNSEDQLLPALVQEVQENFGGKPQEVMADSAYGTGTNLKHLHEEEITALIPAGCRVKENPAQRDDPTQPVAEEDREKLPMNPQHKRLDKAAFVYNEDSDSYRCPMGKSLDYIRQTSYERKSGLKGQYKVYRCGQCNGCPLAERCIGKGKARELYRDEYESYREQAAAKMRDPEERKRYNRRMWIAETPFAILKQIMKLRQFLLRGLENVRTEWLWHVSAYNLTKVVRALGETRGGIKIMKA